MLTVTANTRIEAMSVKIVPPTTMSTVGPCAKPNLWRMVKRRERSTNCREYGYAWLQINGFQAHATRVQSWLVHGGARS